MSKKPKFHLFSNKSRSTPGKSWSAQHCQHSGSFIDWFVFIFRLDIDFTKHVIWQFLRDVTSQSVFTFHWHFIIRHMYLFNPRDFQNVCLHPENYKLECINYQNFATYCHFHFL